MKQYKPLAKGAPLPEQLTTDKFICVKMWCPDIPEYRQALRGQIHSLGQWFFWEKGGKGDRRATEAAAFWRQVIWEHFQMPADPCCCGGQSTDIITRRVNPVTGMLEISINGGDWQPDPTDPRYTGIAYPPPVTIGLVDNKCEASNNVIGNLKDAVEAISEGLGAGASIVELAGAVAAFIVALLVAPEAIPIILPVLISLAAMAFSVGQAAFDAAFTSEVWSQMLCLVYCNIGEDGAFTQAGWDNVLAALPAGVPNDLAGKQLRELWKGLGLLGVNNAAATLTDEDQDCDDCACEGCNVEAWGIRYEESGHFGKINAADPELFTLDIETTGVNTNGKYYIYIEMPDPITQGCSIQSIQAIGGSPGTTDPYGTRRGNAIDDNNLEHFAIFPSAICVSCLQWQDNAPFRLLVTFNPC